MSGTVLAAAGPSPLWYLTRGTGAVALVLLTVSVALGVLHNSRWERPTWPRFATAALHRNVSLLVVVALAVHIVTAELDTFAPVGWLAVIVPFASSYRPVWLGLGTVAFDLLVALVVTSLLRKRIGHRVWRAVHWAAYLSWPVALVHGLGTGTDARVGWVQLGAVVSIAVVVAVLSWRIVHAAPGRRGAIGGGAVLAALAVGIWAMTGPLRPGWAKRAGTPSTLLATASSPTLPAKAAPVVTHGAAPSKLPALPFSAPFAGTLTQTGPDSQGLVTITISGRLSGGAQGVLNIVLQGQSSGGGVSLASSTVRFGPAVNPGQYSGTVVALDGDQLVASVQSGTVSALQLGVFLQIDPSSSAVQGSVQVTSGGGAGSSSSGDGDTDGGR